MKSIINILLCAILANTIFAAEQEVTDPTKLVEPTLPEIPKEAGEIPAPDDVPLSVSDGLETLPTEVETITVDLKPPTLPDAPMEPVNPIEEMVHDASNESPEELTFNLSKLIKYLMNGEKKATRHWNLRTVLFVEPQIEISKDEAKGIIEGTTVEGVPVV